MPINNTDLKRKNWRWATIDELHDDDPLFKTLLDIEDNAWLVDSEGRLVPKSEVLLWLNSYERQTPYQEQSDKINWNSLRNWVVPTLENLKNNPNFTKEQAEKFLAGEGYLYALAQPEYQDLPDEVKQIILNDVLKRRELAYKHSLDMNLGIADYYLRWSRDLIKNDLKYQEYPTYMFKLIDRPNVTGRTYWRERIIKSDDSNNLDVLPHEVIHVLQNYGIDPSPEQLRLLEEAYGTDFTEAQKIDNPSAQEGYDYSKEWEPTNNEVRRELFFNYLPNRLGLGPNVQIPVLLLADPNDVKEATRKSNGYGERYIKYLERKYKNHPDQLQKKLNNIKKAVMFVKNIEERSPIDMV